MAESEYFEKTPKKAGRWFRAFIIFSLLYGITISLYSIINWLLFFAAAYSLFMSYFLLPVQPKIFQGSARSKGTQFSSGGRANSSQPQAQSFTNPNAQRTKAIVIGVSVFIFILVMIPFVQGMIEGFSGDDQQTQQSESVEEDASLNASDLVTTANNFFNEQQYDSALAYYEKALAVDPSYMEAIYGKGIVAYNRNNIEMANRYFQDSYAGGFRYAWLSWALADMYDKQGQSAKAIGLYKESVNLDSSYTDSYKRLAELEPANVIMWSNLARKHAQ